MCSYLLLKDDTFLGYKHHLYLQEFSFFSHDFLLKKNKIRYFGVCFCLVTDHQHLGVRSK